MTVKTVTVSKSHAIMGVALFAALSVSGVQYFKNDERKSKDEFKANLSETEIRLLQQELALERSKLAEERMKPCFDDGYRSCILHMGGAQQTGSYKDGFDAAVKMLENRNYADGYHAAIEQFGYQSKGKEIVPKPEPEPKKSETKK